MERLSFLQSSWDITSQPPPESPESDDYPPLKPLLEFPVPLVMVGLLGASAWFQLHLVTVALAVLLSIVVVCKLWSKRALHGLRAERRLTYARVFPDDPVELVVRLENRKLLPLPWVEVAQFLPAGLLAEGASPRSIARASLLWNQAATFRLPLVGRKRGYYRLRPGVIMSGDPFGVYPRQQALSGANGLIVYPRLLSLVDIGLASTSLFGEITRTRQLLQDPTNNVGTRDYAPGDPVRHVHWKATAKRQHLQVKVFAPSTSLHVVLLLAVDSFIGRSEEDLELAISAAASLAFRINGEQSPVGLLTNARLATGGGEAHLAPYAGEEHLARILETLAVVTGAATRPFEDFLDEHARALPRDAALVCIHADPSAALRERLRRLRMDGQRVLLCTLEGSGRVEAGDAIEEHRLSHLPKAAAVAAEGALA